MDEGVRQKYLVGGQVQGVGFRPFVYRCAVRLGLTGRVGNTSEGVEIEVQGPRYALDAFARDFHNTLPPLARVTLCQVCDCPPVPGEKSFEIVISSCPKASHSVLVSPDVALCAECRNDMADPHNRRYQYPFTNCTNCGPRYTITRSIPYDRASTSMACFPQCPQCAEEYGNPQNRRFHAQPNACPLCGPRLWIVDQQDANPLDSTAAPDLADVPNLAAAPDLPNLVVVPNLPDLPDLPDLADAPNLADAGGNALALHRMAEALHSGRIGAIKGLGGFHLACDAFNPEAVALLRERKHRPHKPLAVMVPDLATARKVALLLPEQEAALSSPQAPIVICKMRENMLPPLLAPDGQSVGLMLPYTPLHLALMQDYAACCAQDFACAVPGLVMTSGNAGGEPICLGNREALRRLAGIADIFLLHNRDILVRVDDSVQAFADMPDTESPAPILYRRSRGLVPTPIHFYDAPGPMVLGMGAELKATLCFTRDKEAFVSQHVGDLQNLETWMFYQEVAAHLEALLEVRPEAIVCDLHPNYMSTLCAQQWARERNLPLLHLQHHAAHGWSVLMENGHRGPALVWALDGNGLGEVGNGLGEVRNGLGEAGNGPPHAGEGEELWGGELLYIDTQKGHYQRLGRLSPLPLPGGDAAVREPWRIAHALLRQLGKPPKIWPEAYAPAIALIDQMLDKGLRCPQTSSCGRLFDAVSAVLGLCPVTSYEGQAAVRLQEAQQLPQQPTLAEMGYLVPLQEPGPNSRLWELDTRDLFVQVYTDTLLGLPLWRIARKFHVALAMALVDMAAKVAQVHGLRHVGLSGGVLQNPTMAGLLSGGLRHRGLIPLLHRLLPPNDGCIAFGQAAFGRVMLAKRRQ